MQTTLRLTQSANNLKIFCCAKINMMSYAIKISSFVELYYH